MIIATFNATTAWAGKAIAWDEGVFTLEGHGAVTAADVLKYDGQGHLDWACAGLQEWVQQVAGVTAAAAIALAKIDGSRAVDLLLESSEARRKTRQSVGGRARRAAAKHS